MAVVLICGDAHQITYEFVTCLHKVLNKLRVELVVSVPRSARQGNGRFKAFEHVYLAGWVLHRRHALDEALLH